MVSLENRLQECGKKKDCSNCPLISSYHMMRNHLSEHYYPWIHDNNPWFTDHGKNHIDSVIKTASEILQNVNAESIDCLEMYLLLVSCIWHDTGMVVSRSNHSAHVMEIINKVRELCLSDPTHRRIVTQIIMAHSGKEGLNIPDLEERCIACSQKTPTVYPKALASILRLADEVSENRSRISPAVLSYVPDNHKIYWDYANSISSTLIVPNRNSIFVDIEIQKCDAVKIYNCPEEIKKEFGWRDKISMIEYIICRLDKMNRERLYCFAYITRYILISQIFVKLKVCEDVDCKSYDFVLGDGGFGEVAYPKVSFVHEFFSKYEDLTPGKLSKGD